jgi:hypothetical protein
MLTRSAVAKRLLRSVATVRRLEGQELFPQRDRNGVLRFDESEVAAVARRLRAGEVPAARGDWLQDRRHPSPWSSRKARAKPSHEVERVEELTRLRNENARLKDELAELTTASAELLEEVESLYGD